MKTIFKQFCLCALIAALTACGGGGPSLSTSASNRAGAEAGADSATERRASVSQESKQTVQREAAGIIGAAFQLQLFGDLGHDIGRDPAAWGYLTRANFMQVVPSPEEVDKSLSSQEPIDEKNLPANALVGRMKNQALKAWAAGDKKKARACWDASMVPLAVFAAYQPIQGWEVNAPMGGRGTKKQRKAAGNYVRNIEISALLASQISAKIAKRLQAGPALTDPKSAFRAVWDAYAKIPCTEQVAIMEDYQPGSVRFDFTGRAQGVGFTSNMGAFDDAREGVIWTRAGLPWFGRGYLEGQKYTLAMVAAQGLNQSTSSSSRQAIRSSSDQDSAAGVDARPGG